MFLQLTYVASHIPDVNIFQSPISGQCSCNIRKTAQQRGTKFFQSPISGQCSCNDLFVYLILHCILLSIPNIGSMFLQPLILSPVCIIVPFFQSPISGQCSCNADYNDNPVDKYLFFQSPISGQCSCNKKQAPDVTAQIFLSIPNIGSMFLQQKSAAIISTCWITFNPQYRVNVLATISKERASEFNSPFNPQYRVNVLATRIGTRI